MNINEFYPGILFEGNNTKFIVLEIEYMDIYDYYLVTYKQLDNNKIRTEPFKDKSVFLKYIKKIDEEYSCNEIINVHTCKPVYFYISNGRMYLNSKTKGCTIYYSYDNNYIEYNNPIDYVDKHIKAYCSKNKYNDSPIMEFDYKVFINKSKNIYLSPSNQKYNKGFEDIGYNTEYEIMNKLADKIQLILTSNGFNVYRNNPDKRIIDWGIESKEKNCSLHLALHSNGSSIHLKKGMEIYVHNYESNMYSLATSLIDNLYNIYPYKEETLNYRGVKEGLDNIGEVDPKYVKNGVLFDAGYAQYHEEYASFKQILIDKGWTIRDGGLYDGSGGGGGVPK